MSPSKYPDREEFLDFPESFQKPLFDRLLQIIGRGESALLFGPPGIGKSTILALLERKLAKKVVSSLFINAESLDLNSQPAFEGARVIILDHLEKIADQKFLPFLFSLKSLREKQRPNLSFVFAADSDITQNGVLATLDPVKRFVAENIILLAPLSKVDAKLFLEKCARLYDVQIKESQIKKIITQSGGVPRLIKRLVKLASDNLDPATDLQLKIDLEKLTSLEIPLLSLLPQVKSSHDSIGNINFSEPLTRQEHDLAKLLAENLDQLVSREEMIEAVWKNKMYDVNDHALDQMLHRLRKKLAFASPKCHLEVYRGRGVKLVN